MSQFVDDHDLLILTNGCLRVCINLQVGGTITSIEHADTGCSVLGTVPWDHINQPEPTFAAGETAWLARYSGGWPLLFPNAGDACTFDGIAHGFHGEASISPWRVDGRVNRGAQVECDGVTLYRRFYSVPVEMERHISIEGDLLKIVEKLRMTGRTPKQVMWGHHPTFGSDLLDGDFEISTGGRTLLIDKAFVADTNPLQPGTSGTWPIAAGKTGPVDLSHPTSGIAAMACVQDFETPWAGVRRTDNSIGVALSWDGAIFPNLWLWYELGGTIEAPWFGHARLLGVEPNSTWPAAGLAEAHRLGSQLIELLPDSEITAFVRLHVFKPEGAIAGVDEHGRALHADTKPTR